MVQFSSSPFNSHCVHQPMQWFDTKCRDANTYIKPIAKVVSKFLDDASLSAHIAPSLTSRYSTVGHIDSAIELAVKNSGNSCLSVVSKITTYLKHGATVAFLFASGSPGAALAVMAYLMIKGALQNTNAVCAIEGAALHFSKLLLDPTNKKSKIQLLSLCINQFYNGLPHSSKDNTPRYADRILLVRQNQAITEHNSLKPVEKAAISAILRAADNVDASALGAQSFEWNAMSSKNIILYWIRSYLHQNFELRSTPIRGSSELFFDSLLLTLSALKVVVFSTIFFSSLLCTAVARAKHTLSPPRLSPYALSYTQAAKTLLGDAYLDSSIIYTRWKQQLFAEATPLEHLVSAAYTSMSYDQKKVLYKHFFHDAVKETQLAPSCDRAATQYHPVPGKYTSLSAVERKLYSLVVKSNLTELKA